jgi:hypothetical protein
VGLSSHGEIDPLMRFVYMRHRTYRPYYPAHSTPFRKNGRLQFRRYRQPGKKNDPDNRCRHCDFRRGPALAVLAFASFANAAERKLARYRSKDEGLADLLNYGAMVDDGVIVGKNGSFMAAWIYEGDDNASSTDRQRDMVSFRINQALAGLGNGWMIHVDAPRRPAAAYSVAGLSHFPDAVTDAIRKGAICSNPSAHV